MIPSPISYWNKTTVTIVLLQGPAQYEVGGGVEGGHISLAPINFSCNATKNNSEMDQ